MVMRVVAVVVVVLQGCGRGGGSVVAVLSCKSGQLDRIASILPRETEGEREKECVRVCMSTIFFVL